MPFPTSALDAGQLAMLRQKEQSSKQFLLITPEDIIFQTQPKDTVDGSIAYAEFEWDGVDQGAFADVKEGQTVLITTSDTDLSTLIYRGRVRKTPTATMFYVNENSTNLETTYYVTVLNDWDIHEKLERRTADGTEYKDWGLTWQDLGPRITNLQSVYVSDSDAATVDIAFAPTGEAGASGAAINTWLWDIDDGAFTVGNANTQNITAQFPGAGTNEHRWVTLTVTDDNGVSDYFAFQVYTIDTTSTVSSVIIFDAGDISVTGTIDEGWNATVRGWANISSILDRTRVIIYSRDNYNGVKKLAFTSGGVHELLVGDTITGATGGATAVIVAIVLDSGSWAGGDAAGDLWINKQSGAFEAENLNEGANNNVATIADDSVLVPITSNVAFVGRLRTERDLTRGDQLHAVVQDTTFTIEGFGTQIGRLVAPGLQLLTDAAPDEWGEIKELTIKRAILFLLQYHTTFLNVSSMTFDASSDDYQWPEFVIQESSILEWINKTADDHNAYIAFASAGESTIQRHASYTGAGGLTTVMTLEVDDSGDSDLLEFTLESEYTQTYAQAVCGASTYSTTTEEATTYIGKAPSQALGPGWDKAALDNQIMKDGLSEADAITEVKLRTGSHLAYVNPHERLNVRLMSGFYWITPMLNTLYAFDIEATDNTRGRAYTSADKWLLRDITYSLNKDTGINEVSAGFEIVTVAGNAGIAVTEVVDVNDLGLPTLPPYGADGPIDPLINYPVDDPDFTLPGDGDWGLDQPEPPQPSPPVGCEQISVSMRDNQNYATSNLAQNAETYIITVEGDGQIAANSGDSYQLTFDNPAIDLPYTFTYGTVDAIGNPNNGAKGEYFTYDSGGNTYKGYNVTLLANLESDKVISQVSFDFHYFHSSSPYNVRRTATLYDSGMVQLDEETIINSPGRNVWLNEVFNFADVPNVRYVQVATHYSTHFAGWEGHVYVDNITVQTTGVDDVYGDAFYHSYNLGEGQAVLYGAGKGFLIDLAKPAGIPLYSGSHRYTLSYTGSNAFIGFRYTDEDGDYSDNQNRHLLVTVCGPGMGSVTL